MTTDNIYEIQNSRIIKIPSDIKGVTDGVRESFYYLKGLTELDIVYSGLKPDQKSKIQDGADAFVKQLDSLEQKLYFRVVVFSPDYSIRETSWYYDTTKCSTTIS